MSGTGLTGIGYFWALLSLIASTCVVAGFYTPFWISGTLRISGEQTNAYFGTFRRCNYPYIDEETAEVRIAEKCGRYSTFNGIPSLFWQISTVAGAVGSLLTVLLTFILLPACCIKDVISKTAALIIGLFQVLVAILISISCVLYPLGWNVQEVRDACGPNADQFVIGDCKFGWSYGMLLIGSVLHLLCAGLSLKGGKSLPAIMPSTTCANTQ